MAAQALVSSSSLTASKEVARNLLGGRSAQSPFGVRKSASFVVKAASTPPVKQGADRQLWFASKQSLSYLDGSIPGDYGFDPLGLSDPEGTGGFIEPRWLAYGEIINGRYAMLGAVGAIAPEILGKLGLIPAETALPWFQTGVIPLAGTYNYWADPYTLFVFELALMGFAEHRRFQDWYNQGSMSKQYFLGLEKYLGGSDNPAYPGGLLFNPLGFGSTIILCSSAILQQGSKAHCNPKRMSNLNKLDFAPLGTTGSRYYRWIRDVRQHLKANGILDTNLEPS